MSFRAPGSSGSAGADAPTSVPQTPPVAPTTGAFEHVIAAVLLGAELSVSETVSVSPLRFALVPSASMSAQLSFGAPSASNTSPDRSVAEWSLVGQLDCRLIWVFL